MSWKQKAYEKLQQDGWIQGFATERAVGRDSDACCAGGAIAWAITGDPGEMYNSKRKDVQAALLEFSRVAETGTYWADLDPENPMVYWDVADWNDESHRTEEEVLDAFKRLAETEVAPE